MGLEAQPSNGNPNPGGAAPSASPPISSAVNNTPGISGPTPAASPTPGHAAPPLPPPPQPLDRTPARKLLGDDDGLPDDADHFEISKSNFKKRLERSNKAQLRQAFGTDNVEEIVAWRTQNEEFKKREEEAKLAQMSETDRFKAMHEKSEQQASYWRQQFEQLQEKHQMQDQDRQVMGIVAKHVKPKCLDFVSQQLALHLQTLEEDELRDPQVYIDQWTEKYIKENPEFGTSPAALTPGILQPPGPAPGGHPAAVVAPRQVPLTNGSYAGRPPHVVPSAGLTKTAAPGQPNSMTDDEWKRYKREQGYTF